MYRTCVAIRNVPVFVVLISRCEMWAVHVHYYNPPSFSLGISATSGVKLKTNDPFDIVIWLASESVISPFLSLENSWGCRGDYEGLIAEKRRDSPALSSVSGIREREQRAVLFNSLRSAIVVTRQLSATSLSFKAPSQVLRAVPSEGRFLEFSDQLLMHVKYCRSLYSSAILSRYLLADYQASFFNCNNIPSVYTTASYARSVNAAARCAICSTSGADRSRFPLKIDRRILRHAFMV